MRRLTSAFVLSGVTLCVLGLSSATYGSLTVTLERFGDTSARITATGSVSVPMDSETNGPFEVIDFLGFPVGGFSGVATGNFAVGMLTPTTAIAAAGTLTLSRNNEDTFTVGDTPSGSSMISGSALSGFALPAVGSTGMLNGRFGSSTSAEIGTWRVVAPVPEPATLIVWSLLGLVGLVLRFSSRMKRKHVVASVD